MINSFNIKYLTLIERGKKWMLNVCLLLNVSPREITSAGNIIQCVLVHDNVHYNLQLNIENAKINI